LYVKVEESPLFPWWLLVLSHDNGLSITCASVIFYVYDPSPKSPSLAARGFHIVFQGGGSQQGCTVGGVKRSFYPFSTVAAS
jgi:hypothetical protein